MTVLDSAQRFAEAATAGRPRPWRRIAVVAALVVIAVAAAWVVWFSPLLVVRDVRVLGATTVSVDTVRTTAAVPLGTPLARVDVDGIAARVGAIPQVGSVEVRRGYPDVLVVVVTERVPIAVVRTGATTALAYLDAAGARFGSVAIRPRALPLVRASGEGALPAALGVLAALPASVRATVTDATARSPDDVVLTLASGATVQWGSPELSERKLAVLTALLPRGAAAYDVSAPDLPTTRGTLKKP